jgi:hypothetical protein
MDASVAALLGALIGAGAGVCGQLVAAALSTRNERRRLAIESGFREWENMHELAVKSGRGADIYPPVLFVHFNHELIQLIDSDDLTAEKYSAMVDRNRKLRDVIRADSKKRAGAD